VRLDSRSDKEQFFRSVGRLRLARLTSQALEEGA
jgi:hypothetical protein